MLAGFFEFEALSSSFTKVVFAIAAAMLGLFLYRRAITTNNMPMKFKVVQVFFEALSFPLIKTFSAVFSCTSGDVFVQTEVGMERFCGASVGHDEQCMDTDPNLACWTSTSHRTFMLVAMFALAPYYVACLQFQAESFARSSVAPIDGTWNIVATQSKFMLAIIASTFGGCYPIVIVGSVLLMVVLQLLLLASGKMYSSVHSLNSVRLAGLLCAAINGLYAVYVLWAYRDDPAGAAPCSIMQNGTLSGVSTPNNGTQTQLVSDYGTFFGLLVANATAIGCGFVLYCRGRKTWVPPPPEFVDLDSINKDASAKEVDYAAVKNRLDAVKRLHDVGKFRLIGSPAVPLSTLRVDRWRKLRSCVLTAFGRCASCRRTDG